MSQPHPERLGRYPVKGVIGAGAMGVVYLGFDPEIARPVAIKTIRKHLIEDGHGGSTLAARFRVEAQAAGRLSHPGIVTVYDVGDDDDCAYIAMEYVAGQSLREYLSRGWRFTASEVASLLIQLLDALGEAHARGVLHRDIKPANLLITDTGRLKVTDFGIARIESTQFTRTESVLGSPGYMAPEQYTGGEVDRRVDIFSAGVVLYRLLTGRMPFSGNDQAMMYRVVYGEPDPLCKDEKEAVLAPFEPVIRRALARQPDKRYASAAEFRQALEGIAAPGWAPQPLAADRLIPGLRRRHGGAPCHGRIVRTGHVDAHPDGLERGHACGHRARAGTDRGPHRQDPGAPHGHADQHARCLAPARGGAHPRPDQTRSAS